MHSNSDKIKITSYNDANEVIDELFDSLCSRYQGNLETSMRERNFIFISIQMLYYKCHKINFMCIYSPGWIKKTKKRNKTSDKFSMFPIRSNCCIKLRRN